MFFSLYFLFPFKICYYEVAFRKVGIIRYLLSLDFYWNPDWGNRKIALPHALKRKKMASFKISIKRQPGVTIANCQPFYRLVCEEKNKQIVSRAEWPPPQKTKGDQWIALNCIWWCGYISADFRSTVYLFIDITPKATPSRSGCNFQLASYGWNHSYSIETLDNIYEVHTISFQTFFVWVFKIGVESWKFTMLLLYILWDDWPVFRISGSNEQLQ